MAKGSGKRRGSLSQAARAPRNAPPPAPAPRWDVNESKSVKSAWIWRAFLMMSLIAVGIAIIIAGNTHMAHHVAFAALWGVIAVGWFAIALWLWRKHNQYMKD